MSIVCHNEKTAKKNALKSDFVVSASSLDNKKKKSRKIYTEEISHDSKLPKKRNTRLKSSVGALPLLRSTQTKTKPNITTTTGLPQSFPISSAPDKVHPMQDHDDPCTVDVLSVPIVTEYKNLNDGNTGNSPQPKHRNSNISSTLSCNISDNPSGLDTTNKLEGKQIPFGRVLQPITATGCVGRHKKYQKLHTSNSKKRLSSSNPVDFDVADNIDNRIEMELSQSSSESNPHMETKHHVVSDVVTHAKVEEAKSLKANFHQKIKLDALANKRQQRKHHVDLKTMTTAEIAAKNKRRSSVMFSLKSSQEGSSTSMKSSLSKKFERTYSLLQTGRHLSANFATQTKAAMDIHGIGQKANLHDCIQSHLADEVLKNWECGSCTRVNDVTRKKRIANAPEVLVFYFRRFKKSGFFQTKENVIVSFPMENLDLGDFCDMTTSNYFKGGWDQKATYDLQVLVRHVGKNKESNHYTTMARHDPEGKWFEYHDHRVRVVSKHYVASKEALMLFYIRKKPYHGLPPSAQSAKADDLQATVRDAVLQRREALVDEINYRKLLIFSHTHPIRVACFTNCRTPMTLSL